MKTKLLHFAALLLVIAVVIAPMLPTGEGIMSADNPLYSQPESSLIAVLEADNFDDPVYVLRDGVVSYRIGRADGRPVGAVFVLSVRGWNPGIIFLVGVDDNGEISGFELIQDQETPGFADFIRNDSFQGQFVGKTAGMEFLTSGTPSGNQVAAATGATVSSQAIFNGADAAVNYFVNNILPSWSWS